MSKSHNDKNRRSSLKEIEISELTNGNGYTSAQLEAYIAELKKVNGELKQARRAALNLMEDAILSKEALQKSEEKYRTLFESIDEGFCIIEMIYNNAGRAINYRFIEVNASFERQTGLKNVTGKYANDLALNTEPYWLEEYDKVVRTGKSVRFENYHKATAHWYEAYASSAGGHQVAIVLNNITERKRREQNQLLLSEISVELVAMDSIDKTIETLGEKIGNYFKVTWCQFAELTGDFETSAASYGWHRKTVASLNGTYSMRDFLSDEQLAKHNAGEISIVSDTLTDPNVNAESYGELGIRSFVIVPLVRDNKWQFLLSVIDNKPREWHSDEVDLIQELATRIWTRLEKARAEEALRINEQQMRGQKEAFQSVINGAALKDSLNNIVEVVTQETAGEARCAFYLANEDHTSLHPVFGAGTMPESYLKRIDGFRIGNDSLACGLAFPTGRPVISSDVHDEPLWKPWLYLAEEYNYRGCWSFPIITRDNKTIGTFAMYFEKPHEPSSNDFALADVVTQTAAVIISTHVVEQERTLAEEALRKSEESFRVITKAAMALAWICTAPDGANVFFNDQWYEYTGQKKEEAAGYGWTNAMHPEDWERIAPYWQRCQQTGEVYEGEVRYRRHDGEYSWFVFRALPRRDADNTIEAWYGLSFDIHDKKKQKKDCSKRKKNTVTCSTQ
jgi:PAS domain S-box-containing protein